MINPDLEIDRLKWRLFDRGWDNQEVDTICQQARDEIGDLILDIVSNAVAESVDYATEIGAEDFLREMTVVESGSSYMIKTISGETDFSKPEQKMLPHLLKNAETSSDGSKYKIIPIKGNKTPTNLFEAMQQRSNEVEKVRESIKNRSRDRSKRANDMADQFRQALASTLKVSRETVSDKRENAGPAMFRTATSKQDPNKQWVIPGKNMDMTQFLMGINERIESAVQEAVSIIVLDYEKEYL